MCRRISVTGSDGVEYTVYSQWPHSIRGYTEESTCFLYVIVCRRSVVSRRRGSGFLHSSFLVGVHTVAGVHEGWVD